MGQQQIGYQDTNGKELCIGQLVQIIFRNNVIEKAIISYTSAEDGQVVAQCIGSDVQIYVAACYIENKEVYMTPGHPICGFRYAVFTILEGELYTQDEVVKLLETERKRAVDIAYSFKGKAEQEGNNRRKAGSSLSTVAFIKDEVANECRIIGNCISGGTALDTKKTMRDRIIKEYFNKD